MTNMAFAQDSVLSVMETKSDVVAHVKILDMQGGKQEEEGVEEWVALGKVVTAIKGTITKGDKIRFRFKRFNFKGKEEPVLVQKGKEYVVFVAKGTDGVRFPSDKKLEVAYSLIDHWTGVLSYNHFLVERLSKDMAVQKLKEQQMKLSDEPPVKLPEALDLAQKYIKKNNVDISKHYLDNIRLLFESSWMDGKHWIITWKLKTPAAGGQIFILVGMEKQIRMQKGI